MKGLYAIDEKESAEQSDCGTEATALTTGSNAFGLGCCSSRMDRDGRAAASGWVGPKTTLLVQTADSDGRRYGTTPNANRTETAKSTRRTPNRQRRTTATAGGGDGRKTTGEIDTSQVVFTGLPALELSKRAPLAYASPTANRRRGGRSEVGGSRRSAERRPRRALRRDGGRVDRALLGHQSGNITS
uniref:Uncharacterized protein n=1 Tax=Plectus sambesii TaxID=2011161 RepID=A0A914W2I5_9BILA